MPHSPGPHYKPPALIPVRFWLFLKVRRELRPVVPRHVLWGSQAGAVFDALRGDFMTDVVSVVDDLLQEGATCVNMTPFAVCTTALD